MVGKLIIEKFKQFGGKHCETASLKKVLDYHGLPLSEEMLFGLGGGVGFIYWYMKMMPVPFIGTRYGKVGDFLLTICKRIGAPATMIETNSSHKGHEQLLSVLKAGEPAICYGDIAYLPYFAVPEIAHFGGHAFVVFGIDEKRNEVYISDRANNPVTITISDLQRARGSKIPPFPPKHRMLRIKYPAKIENIEAGIKDGIKDCCTNMLKPSITNIGLAGIQKWANIVIQWPKQFKGLGLYACLFNTFVYIEISGTGGSAFRTMYAQFLKEASSILNMPVLNEVAGMFDNSGKIWSEIATAALPDSWHTFKRIRELSLRKNKIFEEQKSGALENMLKINNEVDDLMKKAAGDLRERNLAPLLSDLQQKILECYEIERKAFETLNSVITETNMERTWQRLYQ